MLDEFDFFPRTRQYWRSTEKWEQAWRRNLARAPRKHTAEETLAIKHAVWDWREQNPETRPTEERLAASLGVSKQYVSHLAHTLPPRVTFPPTRPSMSEPERQYQSPTSHARPVLEGHGWNCECAGCRINAVIEAARRQA